MQGTKDYQEKLFLNFRLSEHVPKENFYRRLKETLDLSYLRPLTKPYYGIEGQKSIDPEVFFKFMLIGYLENINSDRQIVESAKMRLDMLYFLDYDLDEPLPWHSTLSRTRKLFGEEVFLELFRHILKLCAEKGMVSGRIQAVDSAYIKANASMDSLYECRLDQTSKQYYDQVTANEEGEGKGKGKDTVFMTRRKSLKKNKKIKYNDLFVSRSDPDARVSLKPGKAVALNHLGIISVDTKHHVICGAAVDFANKRDSETTETIVGQVIENLQESNLAVKEVLADGGYSSGDSYRFLEQNNITAYIPVCGGYKPKKERFAYNEIEDVYTCDQGKKLLFKGIKPDSHKSTYIKQYRSKSSDCQGCPLKGKCCKKGENFAEIAHSLDKPLYDKAYNLLKTHKGKRRMRLRAKTVEPVLGTLLHYTRLRKVYTKGNSLANKQILMAAAAYNLKKLMGFYRIKTAANAMSSVVMAAKNTFAKRILILLNLFWPFYPTKFVELKFLNSKIKRESFG